MLSVEEYRSEFLSYLNDFQSPSSPKNLYEPKPEKEPLVYKDKQTFYPILTGSGTGYYWSQGKENVSENKYPKLIWT